MCCQMQTQPCNRHKRRSSMTKPNTNTCACDHRLGPSKSLCRGETLCDTLTRAARFSDTHLFDACGKVRRQHIPLRRMVDHHGRASRRGPCGQVGEGSRLHEGEVLLAAGVLLRLVRPASLRQGKTRARTVPQARRLPTNYLVYALFYGQYLM